MKQPSRHSQPATKLFDHVRELRMRLFVSAAALIIAGIAVYFFYEPLLVLLRSPLDTPLYYSTPAGSFAFVMKICFMGALAVTIPIFIYNLIMFVRPVFEARLSLGRVYSTAALSAVFALAGAVFAFIFIIPGALRFFSGFQVEGLSALISADSYLGFVTNAIIIFMLVFQLPLLITFIDSIHTLPPKKLLKMEKWVILGSLIVSLLVPFALDITTSLLIALPIVVLYNASIILVVLQHAYVKHRTKLAARTIQRNTPQSVFDLNMEPVTSLSLSELSFEGMPNDTHPRYADKGPSFVSHASDRAAHRSSMDMLPASSRPAVVVPRVKILTPAQQAALSSRVPLISDIQRGQMISRALTSR